MMGLWLYAKSNKARISLPLFYNSFCVIFVHHIFGLNFDHSNKQPLRVDSMEDRGMLQLTCTRSPANILRLHQPLKNFIFIIPSMRHLIGVKFDYGTITQKKL